MIRRPAAILAASVLISSAVATATPSEGDKLHLFRITEYRPGEDVGRLLGGAWINFEDCIRAAQKALRGKPNGTEAECSLTSFHSGEGRDA